MRMPQPLRLATARDYLIFAQPFFFAAATVVARFDAIPSAPTALLRPLLVVLVATAILLALALMLTRNPPLAALLTSAFVLISLREPVLGGLFAAIVVWWLLLRLLRLARLYRGHAQNSLLAVARATGVLSVALFFAASGLAIIGQLSGRVTIAPEVGAIEVSGEGGPNIYLILLDGYPRNDVLAETFGHDNTAFTDALEQRGFSVSDKARSNYRKTWLTLASVFNGQYVDDLIGDQTIPKDHATQTRWAQSLINNGGMLEVFRNRGYRIVSVPSAFTSAELLTSDSIIDHGYVNELEANLIGRSPWALLFRREVESFLGSAHRAATLDALSTAAEIAETDSDQPRLAFIHVLSPHTPLVLGEHLNRPPHLTPCFPASCSVWSASMDEIGIGFEEYRERLIEQIQALNDGVLGSVDRIIEADPSAIVVLMSDHGSRYTISNREEQFKSFLAARAPGEPRLFPENESDVNILRRIIRAEFGAQIEPLRYKAWWSDSGLFDLTPVGTE
jgi:hypothetical protein